MTNKYLPFISDEHLLKCIANLHKAYLKAKNNITKKSFYANKVDTFKLTFASALQSMLAIRNSWPPGPPTTVSGGAAAAAWVPLGTAQHGVAPMEMGAFLVFTA